MSATVQTPVSKGALTSNAISNVVGSVARKIEDSSDQVPDGKLVSIIPQKVKGVAALPGINLVPLSESFLYLFDALANACRRLFALGLAQLALKVSGGGKVVCVGMRLENQINLVPVFLDKGEQRVGICRAGFGGRGVEIEHRVDNGSSLGRGVSHDILPCSGLGVVDVVDSWLVCHVALAFPTAGAVLSLVEMCWWEMDRDCCNNGPHVPQVQTIFDTVALERIYAICAITRNFIVLKCEITWVLPWSSPRGNRQAGVVEVAELTGVVGGLVA